jgi:hypothetical protein
MDFNLVPREGQVVLRNNTCERYAARIEPATTVSGTVAVPVSPSRVDQHIGHSLPTRPLVES